MPLVLHLQLSQLQNLFSDPEVLQMWLGTRVQCQNDLTVKKILIYCRQICRGPGVQLPYVYYYYKFHRSRFLTSKQQPVLSSNIAKEDEQAAMAAMFQAQTANWEETQEKMSQLVSLLGAFYLCSSTDSNDDFLFFLYLSSYLLLCSIFMQSAENLFEPTRRDCDSARRQAWLRSPAWSTASCKLCLLSLWKERFARTKFSRKDATNIFQMKVTGYRIVRRTTIENMITNHE